MGLFKKKVHDPNLIYEYKSWPSWIKVFPDRVDFFDGIEKSIPINQIAAIQIGEISLTGHVMLILETAGGKKYKIYCTKRQEVKNAIYQAQANLK